MRSEGKKALVTGGSRGIGRAIAVGLAREGGVAAGCWIEAWHQALPGETEGDVISEVALNDPWLQEHMPRIEPLSKWMAPCAVPDGHPFMPVLAQAWKQVMDGEPEMRGLLGASDASRFQLTSNTATVNFGPGRLDTHLPNESVLVEELVTAAEVMALSILAWCELERR